MPKIIEVHCGDKMNAIICAAIKNYADLAYPKASKSECNQATREALYTAADQFAESYEQQGHGILSRRLRAMTSAAIETHYQLLKEKTGKNTQAQCELLSSICTGIPGDDEMLNAAISVDEQA